MRCCRLLMWFSLSAAFIGCSKTEQPPINQSNVVAGRSKEAKQIVEKAIEAHGGRENLMRLRHAGRIESRMRGDFLGMEVDANMEDTFQFPRQFKKVLKGRFSGPGMKEHDSTIAWAIDGDRVWFQKDGEDCPIEGSPDPQRQSHPFAGIDELISASEWDDVDLLEEATVSKTILVGVRLRNWDPKTDLFFDKGTGLLARRKTEKHLSVPDLAAKKFIEMDAVVEGVCSDFKAIDGLVLPMKLESFLNGKWSGEFTVHKVELVERFEDTVFAKPVKRE